MKKPLTVFFAIIFLFVSSGSALTWPEIVGQAAKQSNDIIAAKKQLEAYRWSYYKSYSPILPQISASASGGNSRSSSGESTSYAYGLSLSQTLFDGFSNVYGIKSAALTMDYYQANLQKTESDYYTQLRQAFVDLAVAQQNVKLREQIKESRANNARMIKLFYESGKEDEGNYRRTEAQLADAAANVVASQRDLELARLKLSQLFGAKVASAEGKFAPSETAMLIDFDALLVNSPNYLMAKDQLELKVIAQQETISEFLPTVSLQGSIRNSGSNWPPASSSQSLTVNASLPIFPGGSNFADRAMNGLLLEKARQDFDKAQKDTLYTIKSAYESYRNALDALSVQQAYVDSSAERAKIAQLKYLNGLTSYNDWDIIQNEYVADQISLLSQQRATLRAEASWYNSYGGYIQ